MHGPQSLRCSCSHTTPPSLPNIQLQSAHTMQTIAMIEAHLVCSECVGCEQLVPEAQHNTTCTQSLRCSCSAHSTDTANNYNQHTVPTIAIVEAHLNCSECVGCEQLVQENNRPAWPTTTVTPLFVLCTHSTLTAQHSSTINTHTHNYRNR